MLFFVFTNFWKPMGFTVLSLRVITGQHCPPFHRRGNEDVPELGVGVRQLEYLTKCELKPLSH